MVLIDDKRNFFLVASLDIFFKNSLDEFPEINMERVQNSEATIRRRWISQNLQEYCAVISFVIRLQAKPANVLNKRVQFQQDLYHWIPLD